MKPQQKPLGVPKIVPRKTPLGVLRAARKLLEDPRRWTQHQYGYLAGRDRDPQAVVIPNYGDPRGMGTFCVLGAVLVCSSDASTYDGAKKGLRDGIGLRLSITGFNDHSHRKHADVLSALDRAIASLSKPKRK